MSTVIDTRSADRFRRIWFAVVAVALYVVLAAVIGDLLGDSAGEDSPTAELALSHLIPLPLAIILGLAFMHRAGWTREVWREPAVWQTRPRRWWMLAIPALLLASSVAVLVTAPWSDRSATFIIVALLATFLVGFGEELFIRGIALTAIRGRHSELTAFIVTSVLFALAHVVGYLWIGIPLAAEAFNVAALTLNGALYYAARRATGSLWAPIGLHMLTDFGLYVQTGNGQASASVAPANVGFELALMALALVLLVSIIRETIRQQRTRRGTEAMS